MNGAFALKIGGILAGPAPSFYESGIRHAEQSIVDLDLSHCNRSSRIYGNSPCWGWVREGSPFPLGVFWVVNRRFLKFQMNIVNFGEFWIQSQVNKHKSFQLLNKNPKVLTTVPLRTRRRSWECISPPSYFHKSVPLTVWGLLAFNAQKFRGSHYLRFAHFSKKIFKVPSPDCIWKHACQIWSP